MISMKRMRLTNEKMEKLFGKQNNFSQVELDLIDYIFLNGSCSPYNIRDKFSCSDSTVFNSMKSLKQKGLVKIDKKEESRTKRDKYIYGLTLGGFCNGYVGSYRNDSLKYKDIEATIKNWQHLCPEILGRWDYLIEERRDHCALPEDHTQWSIHESYYDLPYEVPNNEARYWLNYLSEACWRYTRWIKFGFGFDQEDHIKKSDLIESFTTIIMKEVIFGQCDWNVHYTSSVFRNIPEVWSSFTEEASFWLEESEYRKEMLKQILKGS